MTCADLRCSELEVLRTLDLNADRARQWLTLTEIATAADLLPSAAAAALKSLHGRRLATARRGRWSIDYAGVQLLSDDDATALGGSW